MAEEICKKADMEGLGISCRNMELYGAGTGEAARMASEQTIAAISTPLGEGGIGIVRMSGPESVRILTELLRDGKNRPISSFKDHMMTYGYIVNPETGERIDEVLATVMYAPKSYTREDVVEVSCHGGVVATREILRAFLSCGARLAEPGEFTKRAFLNGRIDLAQAESVIDLIRAKTESSMRLALEGLRGRLSGEVKGVKDRLVKVMAFIEASIDFPEDDTDIYTADDIKSELLEAEREIRELISTSKRGKIYREGLSVVITGKPNVGKSSIMNALLRENRAIVTEIPGTTRDAIEEVININGIPVRLVDTAGIRDTADLVEKLGVERSKDLLNRADLVLLIIDQGSELTDEDWQIIGMVDREKTLVVLNKADLPRVAEIDRIRELFGKERIVEASAVEENGVKELEKAIFDRVVGREGGFEGTAVVANVRHEQSLKDALKALEMAIRSLDEGFPIDLASIDVRSALESLGEITGESVSEEVIERIFQEFCIGK